MCVGVYVHMSSERVDGFHIKRGTSGRETQSEEAQETPVDPPRRSCLCVFRSEVRNPSKYEGSKRGVARAVCPAVIGSLLLSDLSPHINGGGVLFTFWQGRSW